MPLKPVRKVLVSDGIVEQLKGLVDSGELSPGSKLLSETKLAEQLSVSRSSLREALNALVHLGYLERRNRGLCVASETGRHVSASLPLPRSKEEYSIAEMIEIRRIIETQLCSLAAKRAEPDDIRALGQDLQKMKAEVDSPEDFITSDHHFHLCIAKAAKNGILGEFIEKVGDLFRSNIALIVQKSSISRRSLRYHQQIFDAIRRGDGPRARRAMAEHIADIEKEFVRILYHPTQPS
jgi:GntR family transcriptional repressor for pyruvate dehydrogenase complex